MTISTDVLSLGFTIAGALQWMLPTAKWTTGNKVIALILSLIAALGFQLVGNSITINIGNSATPEINGEIVTNSSIQREETTLVPLAELTPTLTHEPYVELVPPQEYTGENNKVEYKIALEENEIIVGQSWGFSCNNETGKNGGCAFIMFGSGTFTFSVTDGEWSRYKNVTTSEKADALLQEKIDYLKETYGYSDDFLKIFRLP